MIKQLEKKDYNYTCKATPMCDHCNSGLCKTQPFGVGDEGVRALGCRKFFLFTIPFIRGVSYSAGAYISFLISRARAQPSGATIS